jgi:hypothetical protein
MKLTELSRLAHDAGLALVQRSEHHYQLTDPRGVAIVDVWPSTNRFRRHNAPEGKKATTGNELSAIQCAKQALPTPLPPVESNGHADLGEPIDASFTVVKPVRLPDSPGWWICEGMPDPVKFIEHPDCGDLYSAAGGVAVPGRWLKVELPTFPAMKPLPIFDWTPCVVMRRGKVEYAVRVAKGQYAVRNEEEEGHWRFWWTNDCDEITREQCEAAGVEWPSNLNPCPTIK